ncbi:hypothetical protein S245_040210 [Arachis hypogaea]|nr:uncharacterized protein DS421_12g367950 [Arachis hypogaea]
MVSYDFCCHIHLWSSLLGIHCNFGESLDGYHNGLHCNFGESLDGYHNGLHCVASQISLVHHISVVVDRFSKVHKKSPKFEWYPFLSRFWKSLLSFSGTGTSFFYNTTSHPNQMAKQKSSIGL